MKYLMRSLVIYILIFSSPVFAEISSFSSPDKEEIQSAIDQAVSTAGQPIEQIDVKILEMANELPPVPEATDLTTSMTPPPDEASGKIAATASDQPAIAEQTPPVQPEPVVKRDDTVTDHQIEGSYTTDYGEMTLQLKGNIVVGTYYNGSGKFYGTLGGNTLTGKWIQSNSKGKLEFHFTSDFSAFTGKWSYNDALPSAKWDGKKQ